MVGDSVLWGHYVDCDGTLSHCLNERSAGHRFDNLGVDGIHPVALAGLVRYYGGAIRDKRVIVNCNLLWISSPRHDLSTEKEAVFNHPALVPQFRPWIPCYRASASRKAGRRRQPSRCDISAGQTMSGSPISVAMTWPHGPSSIPTTIRLRQVTLELPSPDQPPSPEPDARPWTEKGLRRVTPDWVPLEESLQWRFFRQTIQLLQQRGNRVFVLIGPLNEHMLTETGLAEYTQLKEQAAAWHAQQGIPHFAPARCPAAVRRLESSDGRR